MVAPGNILFRPRDQTARLFQMGFIISDGIQGGEGWWARQDSNLQQHGYEPWVLTN
jgi:hypothetical protein